MGAWTVPCEACGSAHVQIDPADPPAAVLCASCLVMLQPTPEEAQAAALLETWFVLRYAPAEAETDASDCAEAICMYWEGIFTRGFIERVAERICEVRGCTQWCERSTEEDGCDAPF